jgi:GntR family transcriptional regulator
MFVIDVMSRVPVYEQIIKQVEEQVLTGILKEGDKLPSVRSLSVKLSINPNTIQKAYTELDRRQLIITVPGKGSFISQKAVEVVGASSREKIPELAKIIRDLALAGVTKDEIIRNVNEVFEEMEGEE